MVTPAQAAANVRTATVLVARQLGFYSNDGSGFKIGDLLPSQQITLTNAVADYVKANPALFDTGVQDLTNPVKSAVLARNTQVGDTGGGFGDYVKAVGDEALDAGNKVAGIGQGVLNLAAMAKWLIPLAAVLFLAVMLWGEYNKRKGPPAASA